MEDELNKKNLDTLERTWNLSYFFLSSQCKILKLMFKTHSIRHSNFANLTALTQYRSVTETDKQTGRHLLTVTKIG